MIRCMLEKSVHEGGTKFYSNFIFSKITPIASDDGTPTGKTDASVCVHHWGSVGRDENPKRAGDTRCKLVAGKGLSAVRLASEKKVEKKLRGYETWVSENIGDLSDGDFLVWAQDKFPSGIAKSIMFAFGITEQSVKVSERRDEEVKKVLQEAKKKSASEVLETWGSW